MNKEYKFSIIMAIYNSEKYLNEAIDSIINQTIGFEDNIQLILVNDGSTDKSEDICLLYKNKYPDNIVYHKKENGGASSARNAGRQFVKGKYLNFFDSDDIWDLKAFEIAFDFFEKHYNEIDIIVGRTIHFGDKIYEHPLDYKFEYGSRVVDLTENYEYIQLGNAPCIFKTSSIENLYYDTNLFVSEDTFFIAQATLKTLKHGLISELIYNYRKIGGESSLSTMCRRKREWYFNTLTYCHKELIRLSIDRYGFVPKYIQYMLLYELQWRIYKHNITDDTLSREDKLEYRSLISDILKAIDDDVIYRLKNRTLPFKAYLYKLKYGKNILAEAEIIDNKFLYYKGNRVYNFKLPRRLVIKILEIKDNKLILDGHTDLISVGEKYKLYAEDNNEILYPVELSRREYKDSFSFCDEMILRAMAFKVEIPLSDIKSVKFVLIRDDGEKIKLTPGLGIFSGMTETMKSTYRNIDNKYIIKYINNELRIYPYRKKMHIASEHRFLKELKSLDKDYIVKDRLKYYILKLFYRKPIWIVRDRFEKAGDNGESVFKYLSKWEDKSKYNIVFLLKKNSKDYNRLCKYGKVLDPDSNKYKFYFLLSSKIIDSIVTLSSINPFDKDRKYYSNLLSFDYVALFHGIGQRDMSDWTNKYNYNIKLYVSGAKREYEAMLKENNGYDENIIKLTGLPRFDDLENNNSKTLIFMPTWRNDIAGPIIPGTTQRKFVESFKNTEYLKFYNSLINDERLLTKMEELGYNGVFYNHPNFRQQYDDYIQNDLIKVSKENADAIDVISNCAMLITDYSSAFFECAYLNKPVVYTQFDSDTFVERHTGGEGYFNYETDSFGPICYDLKSSVDAIIYYMENGCKNDKIYEDRINEFIVYRDKLNSKRLVDEIVKLDEIKKEG